MNEIEIHYEVIGQEILKSPGMLSVCAGYAAQYSTKINKRTGRSRVCAEAVISKNSAKGESKK